MDLCDESVEPLGQIANLVLTLDIDALGEVAFTLGDIFDAIDETIERSGDLPAQEDRDEQPQADPDNRRGHGQADHLVALRGQVGGSFVLGFLFVMDNGAQQIIRLIREWGHLALAEVLGLAPVVAAADRDDFLGLDQELIALVNVFLEFLVLLLVEHGGLRLQQLDGSLTRCHVCINRCELFVGTVDKEGGDCLLDMQQVALGIGDVFDQMLALRGRLEVVLDLKHGVERLFHCLAVGHRFVEEGDLCAVVFWRMSDGHDFVLGLFKLDHDRLELTKRVDRFLVFPVMCKFVERGDMFVDLFPCLDACLGQRLEPKDHVAAVHRQAVMDLGLRVDRVFDRGHILLEHVVCQLVGVRDLDVEHRAECRDDNDENAKSRPEFLADS